jgi:hypothetical protein
MDNENNYNIEGSNYKNPCPKGRCSFLFSIIFYSVNRCQAPYKAKDHQIEILFEEIAYQQAVEDCVNQGELSPYKKGNEKYTELKKKSIPVALRIGKQENIGACAEYAG